MVTQKKTEYRFLLTDELYATAMLKEKPSYVYMLGAGFSFYVSWVLFSLMGILLANKVPDLSTLHLEFSIVVVFLVMAVMLILSWFELGSAILLAGFSGMWIAALFDQAED